MSNLQLIYVMEGVASKSTTNKIHKGKKALIAHCRISHPVAQSGSITE